MKGQVASVLIVATLIVGAGLGYFVGTSFSATKTVVSTYTTTLTLPQGTFVERCVVTEYGVWSIESVSGTQTTGGTSTQSHPVTTYQTSATVSQTVGYETTMTTTYTGTLTGAIASWNSTACTYIPV